MASISYPIDAFPDQSFNLARLASQCDAALGPGVVTGLASPYPTVTFTLAADLTSAQRAVLDGIVATHHDDDHDLEIVRRRKFDAIEKKTHTLIDAGFEFRGKRFSLTDNAKTLLLGMEQLRSAEGFPYPLRYNTVDDTDDVVLEGPDDIHALFLTAQGHMRMAWDSGTQLKQLVRAATTVDELDAIKDER